VASLGTRWKPDCFLLAGDVQSDRFSEVIVLRQRTAGTIAELWRYPIKSMLGEQRSQLAITPRGSLGDRAKALRDLNTGKIASAKKFPRLLDFRARYEVEPTYDTPGRIEITTPEGRTDDPEASAIIGDALGHPVRFKNEPRSEERTEINRETVFGDVPVNKFKPDWTPETMPDYFQLMKESFFEIGAVFVVASGSMDPLHRLQGGTAKIDRRRFRPNIWHGPMWDLAESTDSIALNESFYNSGKPIALVCHSPGCSVTLLTMARHW
jgi:uncharacterized protein